MPGGAEPPDSYIDYVFNLADALLPADRGMLLYNDYLGESSKGVEDHNKAKRVFRMVKAARARGVPIEGIGLQFHVSIWHSGEGAVGSLLFGKWMEGVREVMSWYADIGVEVHVTELDVGCTFAPFECPAMADRQREELQATVYSAVVRECLHQPACKVIQTYALQLPIPAPRALPPPHEGLTPRTRHTFPPPSLAGRERSPGVVPASWGFTDKISWRRGPPDDKDGNANQRAHLFDDEYRPKLAAFAYSQALAQGRPAAGVGS